MLRVADLNSKLCSTVVALSPALRSPASSENPFGSFDYLTTYHPEQRTAVMELIIAVEKGMLITCKSHDWAVESSRLALFPGQLQ